MKNCLKEIVSVVLLNVIGASFAFGEPKQSQDPPISIKEESELAGAPKLVKKTTGPSVPTDLRNYLVDTASGSISAASMLGVSGDSITTVENVRDISVALKNLGNGDSKTAIAFSIAPARTSFLPMSIRDYAYRPLARLAGATSIGYAQGDATIQSKDYHRQALSLEAHYYFSAEDDPLIRHWKRISTESKKNSDDPCNILRSARPDGLPEKPNAKSGSASENSISQSEAAADISDTEIGKEIVERGKQCREKVEKEAGWNRSRISLALASGWIKPTDGSSDQRSLGRTAVLSVLYGFDGLGSPSNDGSLSLRDNAAISLTLRRTMDEPVLDTLGSTTVVTKNSNLAVVRFTAGSEKLRALVEVSNADNDQITASQRTFKTAVGVDLSLKGIAEGAWLSFRLGRQRTIDGSTSETVGFVTLSISPTALSNLGMGK